MATETDRSHAEPRRPTIALLWRGDREARAKASAGVGRLGPLFEALAALGLEAVPCVYLDEMIDEARAQLLAVDGVLVWVNPVAEEGGQ
jgi:hypothetical protein